MAIGIDFPYLGSAVGRWEVEVAATCFIFSRSLSAVLLSSVSISIFCSLSLDSVSVFCVGLYLNPMSLVRVSLYFLLQSLGLLQRLSLPFPSCISFIGLLRCLSLFPSFVSVYLYFLLQCLYFSASAPLPCISSSLFINDNCIPSRGHSRKPGLIKFVCAGLVRRRNSK